MTFDKGVIVKLIRQIFSLCQKSKVLFGKSVEFALDCLHKTNLLLCIIAYGAVGIKYIYSVLC